MRNTIEASLAKIEQAAMACMAKVSFTPDQLIMLVGIALVAGVLIGALGMKVFGSRRT